MLRLVWATQSLCPRKSLLLSSQLTISECINKCVDVVKKIENTKLNERNQAVLKGQILSRKSLPRDRKERGADRLLRGRFLGGG